MIDPQPPAPVFENGAHVKVRRLQGVFTVLSSRIVGKVLRYRLDAVPDTGCILTGTESFAEDMQLVPAPEPAPELALMPDPPAPHSSPQELAAASPGAAAPAAERSAADAIRSPGASITLSEDPWITERREIFGDDENLEPFRETSEEDMQRISQRSALREVRFYPAVAMPYSSLKNIIYSSKFKGMENGPYEELDDNTPVGVVVTRETNGAAVWIVTTRDRAEVREARLELFYPADHIQNLSCETGATEHGVLLALRKVPIRTNDLEILLLQLES